MTPSMPGPGGLLARTALAAVAGAFIVVCVVLPAEYRKDPTGFGRLTGLLDLSTPRAAKPDPVAAAPAAPAAPSTVNAWFFPTPYRSETIVIPIGPDGELEYKIKMKAGQAIVYSWLSDNGNVYYDFHGEPPDNPKGSQTYKKDEELRGANGAFVAPFAGVHGWYWVNLTAQRIKITLKISGFYESHGYVK
jgi:hypothetical protein